MLVAIIQFPTNKIIESCRILDIMVDITISDKNVINVYERLWPDARRIQSIAYKCGGPQNPQRAADYLGFDLLNGGLREVWALADRLGLDSESEVLELGSGVGGPARFIAERYHCHVVGVDLTPHQVKVACKLSKQLLIESKIDFMLSDARKLPFLSQSFSHVYSIEALVHVTQKPRVLCEAFRVLRKGGVLCITDLIGKYDICITALDDTIHPISLDEYMNELEKVGFCKIVPLNRTEQSEEGYQILTEFVSSGPISPLKLLAMFERIHPGIRPSIWRCFFPKRIRNSVRYLFDRYEAARELFGDPHHIERVSQMCKDIVSAYQRGDLKLFQICASRPCT